MSVTGGHQVRAPHPGQAEELGRLHLRIWRDTYRKHGFEPDGATMRDEEPGADEIRMVRR